MTARLASRGVRTVPEWPIEPASSDLRGRLRFPFDEYQIDACRQVEAGSGVLVAAPTGAGKTIVGEFAVFLALAQGRKCFYTTPIKALEPEVRRSRAPARCSSGRSADRRHRSIPRHRSSS